MFADFEYFTIFGVMRTGSNLLERNLNQYDGLLCHGELFNPAFMGKPGHEELFGMSMQMRESRPDVLLERMQKDAAPQMAGFRLFQGHDKRIMGRCLMDRNCAKVILRRNILDSYISLKIARETDQWMLRNPKRRRSTKVMFSLNEYQQYRRDTEQYYAYLRRVLHETGQAAFEIDYSELKSLSVMNGLVQFVSDAPLRDDLEEVILKQNPAELSEKVTNFEEMQAQLAGLGGVHRTEASVASERSAGVRLMSACESKPLLFAAVPGGPTEVIQRWMWGVDGGVPTHPEFVTKLENGEVLRSFTTKRQLNDWQAENPGGLSFTVVRHPLLRVYDAFMTRILPGGDVGYPMIREQLRRNYDLIIPDESVIAINDRAVIETYGYSLEKNRAAFLAFLKFVQQNLTNRTSIRADALWADQIGFVDGFNTAGPLSLVVREDQLIRAANYIKLGIDAPDARNAILRQGQPEHLFPLEDVITPEIEALCRDIYARDYATFGFGEYMPEREAEPV